MVCQNIFRIWNRRAFRRSSSLHLPLNEIFSATCVIVQNIDIAIIALLLFVSRFMYVDTNNVVNYTNLIRALISKNMIDLFVSKIK